MKIVFGLFLILVTAVCINLFVWHVTTLEHRIAALEATYDQPVPPNP